MGEIADLISKDSLDPGLLGDLEKMGINRGEAFLKNTSTSLFIKKNASGDSIASVASGVAGVAGAAAGGVGNIVSGAALTVSQAKQNAEALERLTQQCIETLTSAAIRCSTTYTTKITAQIAKYPVDVVQRTAYWFKVYYPIHLQDRMDVENISMEDFLEKEKEKSDKKQEEADKKGFTEKLGDLQKKINEIMQTVQKPLQDISSYAAEGPQFLIDKCNKVTTDAYNTINKECDKVYNNIKKWEETSADKRGEKLGDKKAAEMAQETVNAMKALKYESDKLTSEQETKAKAQVKKALLKLKGLMGA